MIYFRAIYIYFIDFNETFKIDVHFFTYMISFACKNIDLKDLVMCSFDLNKTDYKLFNFLIKKKIYLSVNEISEKINLDRTSVQKSLKRLHEKNIVLRLQKNIDSGGYLFTYLIKDKELIKKLMLEMVSEWHQKVKKEVEEW
jgi:predicted transcriptional regulator